MVDIAPDAKPPTESPATSTAAPPAPTLEQRLAEMEQRIGTLETALSDWKARALAHAKQVLNLTPTFGSPNLLTARSHANETVRKGGSA